MLERQPADLKKTDSNEKFPPFNGFILPTVNVISRIILHVVCVFIVDSLFIYLHIHFFGKGCTDVIYHQIIY